MEKNNSSHIALIVHILKISDRFAKNFESWSVTSTTEIDSIVVTLQEDAVIDANMINLMYTQYPLRIRGPFLKEKLLIIDFMKDDSWQFEVGATDNEYNSILEPSKKKVKYTTTDKVEDPSIIDTAELKSRLLENLQRYNSLEIGIGRITSGNDVDDTWISIPIENVEKINVGFIKDFITSTCLPNLKV